MATRGNLYFDIGEDWVISMVAHTSDGAVLDLTGARALLRIASLTAVLIDTTGLISDALGGQIFYRVTPEMQAAAGFETSRFYSVQARVILADGSVSDQYKGTLYPQNSLYEQFA